MKKLAILLLSIFVTAFAEAADWSTGVTYTYDGSGNISKTGPDFHVYDAVGRLVQSDLNSVRRNYTYDAFGNRTGCSQLGTDCQYGYGINSDNNQLLDPRVHYDASGNVDLYAGRPYDYDQLNMQKRDGMDFDFREYVYTADDERIAVYTFSASWRWTVRDTSGKVLREFTSSNFTGWKWEKDHVWRDGQLLASRQTDGVYHYHLDHLGTPRRITDSKDYVLGIHDYHAYGPEAGTGTNEPSLQRMKFTGHERDVAFSEGPATLDYMHARYYGPAIGRFLSVDPVCGLIDRPQSWNRYAYAFNNPLMYTDPTGRYLCKITVSGQDAKAAGVPDGTEIDGVCVDARDPAKEDEDKKRQQRPRPQIVPGLPSTNEASRPDGPVTMLTGQLANALDVSRVFLENYLDMREANTVGADRYFHCMANCKGARQGQYGAGVAERFGNAREVWDQNVKRYPRSDALGDQAANAAGRNGALSLPCETVCAGFRPAALPSRY